MRPRLYVIPASPPCLCIEAALHLKGIEHDLTELPNVLHIPHQLVRFRVPTVPTMRLGREKVAGSRAIARRLDELAPSPPLLGSDPAGRADVLAAEAWADEVLQAVGRRVIWWALRRCHAAMPSYVERSRMPLPPAAARLTARVGAPVIAPLGGMRTGSSDDIVRRDLRRLPAHLAEIERWLDGGVLGGDPPTIADLQIGAVVRLLLTIEDLVPVIRTHPRIDAHARRLFPEFPGHVPAGVLPPGWLSAAGQAASGG